MQQSICEAKTSTTLRRMGYNSRRTHRVPIISTTNIKKRLQFEEHTEKVEKCCLVWWVSISVLRHSHGTVRIWRKQNENMDPSCLVTTVQAGGGVGDVFLAHFRPLSNNWALFKCHSLPEHCFWSCPSLYGHHLPIFWWLLPAG